VPTNLSDLTGNLYKFVSDPEVISAAQTLIEFSDILVKKRNRATEITNKITLNEAFFDSSSVAFESEINKAGVLGYFTGQNRKYLTAIYSSNPNFNYLYSNLSANCSEPFYQEYDETLSSVPQSVLDLAYGSNLDRLEFNRNTNQVNNADWIRVQTCSPGTNLLLKGANATEIAEFLCLNLNDTMLSFFFTTISRKIDFTSVKYKVYNQVYKLDITTIMQLLKAATAARTLQAKLQQANLVASNDLQSYTDLFQQISIKDLSATLCSGSQLSLFDLLRAIRIVPNNKQLARLGQNLRDNQQLAKRFSDLIKFDMSVLETVNLNIKIPRYYQNPYEDIDKPNLPKNGTATSRQTSDNSSTTNLFDDDTLESLTLLLIEVNNLKQINESLCPIKRPEADQDKATLLLVNSTTKSCFCQQIYSLILGSSGSAGQLFSFLKPMFLGKILYAPSTPAYNRLIKKMNGTFEAAEQFGLALKQLSQLVEDLRVELKNPNSQGTVTSLVLTLDQLFPTLSIQPINFTSLNKQLAFLAEILLFSHNAMSCVELNKFIGFSSEEEAVDLGLKLIDKEAFWSALIFQNPELNDSTLPDIVSYKIRMNASQVHDTIYTQDRFYKFDSQNCLGCNSYFTYGFIYIQDMLEKSIVEIKTNSTQPFGIVGQMTPYPCYVDDR